MHHRVGIKGGLKQFRKKVGKTLKSAKGNVNKEEGSDHSPLHAKKSRSFLSRQPSSSSDRLVSVSEATTVDSPVVSRPFRLSTSSHVDMVSANVINKVFNILTFWVQRHFEVRK